LEEAFPMGVKHHKIVRIPDELWGLNADAWVCDFSFSGVIGFSGFGELLLEQCFHAM
jgi:hypothetical protein